MKNILWLSTILFFLALGGCKKNETITPSPKKGAVSQRSPMPSQEMKETDRSDVYQVLPSGLAGRWYPKDPAELKATIAKYQAAAKTESDMKPIALIVPHAGYLFSGPTAAAAYKTVAGKRFKRVFLIGLIHRGQKGVALPKATHFSTPLGQIPVDVACLNQLEDTDITQSGDQPFRLEHSLEIQLPFIQSVLAGGYKIVPIGIGHLSAEELETFGRRLKRLITKDDLVVVSSDFTHYGPNYGYEPFSGEKDIEEKVKKLDHQVFDYIKQKDVLGLAKFKAEKKLTVCGLSPIMVLLQILPAEAKANLLKYETSKTVLKQEDSFVGYMAIAFTGGEWQGEPYHSFSQVLSSAEQKDALKLARAAVFNWVKAKKRITPDEALVELTAEMKKNYGVFVTLKKNHQLRGCIGYLQGLKPLHQAIVDNAINASTRDNRFSPVSEGELQDIEIEVSVLTAPQKVKGYQEIRIGRHGVILKKGGSQAVFLPQVAPEQGWDLPQTLEYLSMKAGLSKDAWKKADAQFYVFEAHVF